MTDGADGGQVRPGWYPDPKRVPRERYFDGSEWTSSVRDGETVTSDPMGPLPAGREAWISPVVMALRDRPPEPTWWTRHRRQVVLAIAAVCLGGLVTVVIVRPATLETIGFVAIVVIVFALRFSLGRRPDDGQHATRWFPRE